MKAGLSSLDLNLPSAGLALLLAAVLALTTAFLGFWSWLTLGDTLVYYKYAYATWHGAMPYRDFSIEYLPGVLPLILLAYPLGLAFNNYAFGFLLLSTLAIAVVFWDMLRQKAIKQLALVCVLILFAGQFYFFELDIFAGLALYGALRFLYAQRYYLSYLSAVLLGVATLIKSYPFICLPAFVLALPKGQRWRFAAITIGTVSLGLLPFIIFSPDGLWQAFTYHSGRPLQIESTPSAVGFLLHIFGTPIALVRSHMSWALQFPQAHILNSLSSVILAGGFLALCWFLAGIKTHKVALESMLLLLFFILAFKVGSPQFLVPLVLVSLLAQKEILAKQWLYLRLLLISIVVGVTLFFGYYWLVPGLRWYGGLLVVLRVFLEVELFIWLIRKSLQTK